VQCSGSVLALGSRTGGIDADAAALARQSHILNETAARTERKLQVAGGNVQGCRTGRRQLVEAHREATHRIERAQRRGATAETAAEAERRRGVHSERLPSFARSCADPGVAVAPTQRLVDLPCGLQAAQMLDPAVATAEEIPSAESMPPIRCGDFLDAGAHRPARPELGQRSGYLAEADAIVADVGPASAA